MSHESALAMTESTNVPTPTLTADVPLPNSNDGSSPPGDVPETQLRSSEFAKFAKKEAEIVAKQQALKKEKEEWQPRIAKLTEAETQFQAYQKKKAVDPIGALKDLGFSETDVLNYMASNPTTELTVEQKAAQAAQEAADATLKQWEQQQFVKTKQQQVEQDSRLIDEYKSQLSKVISSDKDKYEYCSFYTKEAEALAYEITLEVVRSSQGEEIITPEEAIQMAEEYYEARDVDMAKLKKRQGRPPDSSPDAVAASPVAETLTKGSAPRSSRTLDDRVTSTVASMRHTAQETREQKKERLIQRLRQGN